MRKHQTKTVNQTFSIPSDVSQELHTYVKRREMSRFVSEAIRKELKAKKEELRRSYQQANEDEGQEDAIKDWENTIADDAEEW